MSSAGRAATASKRGPVHVARSGNVRIGVYRFSSGRYCVAWTPGRGLRQKRETFPALSAAKQRAHEVADALESGRGAVLELTGARIEGYLQAMRLLEPLGISLPLAIEEYAAARALLPPGESLATALRGLRTQTRRRPAAELTGSAVLARLVASLSETPPATAGEYRYRQGIRMDLGKFVAAHPRLEQATAQTIREYLRGLAVGPRRRDNIRDEIVTLFRFAKTKDGGELFPADAITEPELVKRLDVPTAITTYTAEELRLLLKHVSPRWLPWLAIAAFAGMRPSEILRLDWSAFEWTDDPPAISLSKAVARKTNMERRAELGATLRLWLAPLRDAIGPIYGATDLPSENRLLDQLARETKRLGAVLSEISGNPWHWKRDALRHSYGSYRYAQTKDFVRVADWMGNSVAVVKKRYYRSKREQEGNAWFSVLPADAANVVQMGMQLG